VVYYLPGGVYFLGVDGNSNMESIMNNEESPFSDSTLILIYMSAAIVWICIIAGIIILIVK